METKSFLHHFCYLFHIILSFQSNPLAIDEFPDHVVASFLRHILLDFVAAFRGDSFEDCAISGHALVRLLLWWARGVSDP